MQISVVLFEDFELLDVFGPVELFSFVDGWEIQYVAQQSGLVKSRQGIRVEATYSFDDVETTDLLLVPGGQGTRPLSTDTEFLKDLTQLADKANVISSVCTGSTLLAATGLLEGYSATSNKRSFEWATSFGDDVQWQARARWVEDGNRWTSSGIAAGIDMAAAMIRRWEGQAVLDQILKRAEIEVLTNPADDPFAIG